MPTVRAWFKKQRCDGWCVRAEADGHWELTQFEQGRPVSLDGEVLSPNRPERDRIVKKGLFAANGVGEYWIVDPASRSVEVFALEEAEYAPAGWFTDAQTVVSLTLPGLRIPLSDVFRPES